MSDKTQLMQAFDRAHSELRSLLPGIDIHKPIYPSWTIKELLAHLAGWDDATITTLRSFEAREAPPILASRGIDDYNAQTVAERAELGYEQIVREWEWVREQLMAILDEMEPEKLEERVISSWGVPMTVAQLIEVLIEHEEEHATAIRDWLAATGQ